MIHYNTWLKCLNVDHKRATALVQSNRTGRSFPVTLTKSIRYLVNQGDFLHVVKSHVSKEWMAIDYNSIIGGDLE